MKKLGMILAGLAALAIVALPTAGALAAKKAAPKPKKLWQGWVEEVKKAKWHWKAPAKKSKKK